MDDPITNVDNIQRHILMKKKKPSEATLAAVSEVLPPVIMSTLAIIVSFVPYFYYRDDGAVHGSHGCQCAVDRNLFNVLRPDYCALAGFPPAQDLQPKTVATVSGPGRIEAMYTRIITPFLDSRARRWLLVGVIGNRVGFSMALAGTRQVPLKMLPFDNKNEFQIVIDMDEGTPLEQTDPCGPRNGTGS